jgi:SpoVK/Ycf46/Vps4 family AAA+-type ATPase
LLVGLQRVDQQETKGILNGDEVEELDYVTLASMTEGYTAADLKDLVGSALQQAIIRCAQSEDKVCTAR